MCQGDFISACCAGIQVFRALREEQGGLLYAFFVSCGEAAE